MMPLVIGEGSRHRAELTDLAIELAARSAGFRRSLPASIRSALAELVRSMNCYYSNLIEGHDTHPIDIERALHDDYSKDAQKARPPTRGESAYRRCRSGSTPAPQRHATSAATHHERLIADSASACRKICCGWRIRPRTGASRSIPARFARPRRAGRRSHRDQSRRCSAFPRSTSKRYIGDSGQDRADPGGCGSASPFAMDSSVPRRQRPCRTSDVSRHAARYSGYWRRLVDLARSRAKCRAIQRPLG